MSRGLVEFINKATGETMAIHPNQVKVFQSIDDDLGNQKTILEIAGSMVEADATYDEIAYGFKKAGYEIKKRYYYSPMSPSQK